MNRNAAFTLLELLVVLAILAIVLPLALNWIGRATAVQQVRQAQQDLAQLLNQARSQARRTSLDWQVEVQPDQKTLKLRRVNADNSLTDFDTVVLSSGSRISASTPTSTTVVRFTAPFGRRDAPDTQFQLQPSWAVVTARVNIVGVTGKVVSVDALN